MTTTKTILVTGANGFIAQHIIKIALSRGYNVRGTGRSISSLEKLRSTFPKHASQLSFVSVPDMTDPASYKDAFADVTDVIHTASPFVLNPKDNVADILDPAVKGSLAILEAASKYGSSTVKRVVVTSSFAAILDLSQGYRPGYTYTEADWNPMTWDEASTADGVSAYCASKGLAEKAMWDWMDAHKDAPFTLTSINPPWVFGPSVTAPSDLGHLNESTHSLWGLVDNKDIPPVDFAGFVDVRTIAEAHVLALENDEAAGERFLVGSHFDYQAAADGLRRDLPQIKDRIPEGKPGVTPEVYSLDGSKAEKVLGVKYIPINVTVKDSISQLLVVEAAAKA